MDIIQAIILGIIQGLTEFLPVSSSGHLEIGKVLLGVKINDNLAYTVALHCATALSTIVVFRKEIANLFVGFFKFKNNEETSYVFKLLISMIPVGLVGVFLKDKIEALFEGNLLLVGSMLLLTALLLAISYFYKPKVTRPVSYLDSIIIGIAQAIAVLPGLSRSGSTIATGLIVGNNKPDVARFSFLMVILPILGMTLLDIKDGAFSSIQGELVPMIAGFISAFIVGYIACRWMISIVKRGKLIWFALYCLIVGSIAIGSTLL
jgi:undecaprenyl-diphosphatase